MEGWGCELWIWGLWIVTLHGCVWVSYLEGGVTHHWPRKGIGGWRGGGSQILVPDTWEECKNWKLEDTNEPDIAVEKFQTWVTETEDQGEREGTGVMLRTWARVAGRMTSADGDRSPWAAASTWWIWWSVWRMAETAAYAGGNFQQTVGVYFQKTIYGC